MEWVSYKHDLPLDLAGAAREELIEIIGQLLGHIESLEARIASWKANRRRQPLR